MQIGQILFSDEKRLVTTTTSEAWEITEVSDIAGHFVTLLAPYIYIYIDLFH